MKNDIRSESHALTKRVQMSIAIVLLFLCASQVYAQGILSRGSRDELETFNEIFNYVYENYVESVDPEVLLEGALRGLFESLEDPYSVYLDSSDLRSLGDTTSGEFGGVGIYINKVRTSDENPELLEWVEIVSPIEGTPAFRAGLRPRDLIVEIEGESTVEMSIDEVVSMLRGEPQTSVNVTILRNMTNRFQISLRRAIIVIPTVRYAGIEDDIAYVRIIQFTPNTAERSRESFQELKSMGYEKFIIDLRTNPGGLLSAAIDTADLFFNDGLIVGTSARSRGESNEFYAERRTTVLEEDEAEIVVLINEGTASAAEILAGAFKDRGRAAIVGSTSYGKGSVQQIRVLGDAGFRLTMSRYYTPNNVYIDEIGIIPDIEVLEDELSEEEEESMSQIQSEQRVEAFLDSTDNNPQEGEILNFITDLEADGLVVNERILRRLLKVELEARLNETSVYDLNYDLVLQEAVGIMRSGQTSEIIRSR